MPHLNCMDNPPQDSYSSPCIYHGWMNVSKRITFFTYKSVEKHIPIAVAWDGTRDDLDEQLQTYFEVYCQQKGLQATCTYRGGDGDYYATIVLDRVEEVRTPIPPTFLKAFE